MKIKAKELADILSKLRVFLPTYDVRPIFSCFLFDGDRLAAFNGECALVYSYPIGFKVAVNGELLYKLLSSIGQEANVILEPREEHLQVRIESGKGKSKLIGI